MNFDGLMSLVGHQAFFDLAMVIQLSGEERKGLRTQLSRWTKAGKLLSLRRGMYAFAERYRRASVNPAELANYMHRPSYLTAQWALAFYGMIPERAVTYTSVTPRVPRRFTSELGVFVYRHIKQTAFFGYRAAEVQGRKVLLADPEKALLDLWHFEHGEWSKDRMIEVRFQNFDSVDEAKLDEYATRFRSPRLRRSVKVWEDLSREDREETVYL